MPGMVQTLSLEKVLIYLTIGLSICVTVSQVTSKICMYIHTEEIYILSFNKKEILKLILQSNAFKNSSLKKQLPFSKKIISQLQVHLIRQFVSGQRVLGDSRDVQPLPQTLASFPEEESQENIKKLRNTRDSVAHQRVLTRQVKQNLSYKLFSL